MSIWTSRLLLVSVQSVCIQVPRSDCTVRRQNIEICFQLLEDVPVKRHSYLLFLSPRTTAAHDVIQPSVDPSGTAWSKYRSTSMWLYHRRGLLGRSYAEGLFIDLIS